MQLSLIPVLLLLPVWLFAQPASGRITPREGRFVFSPRTCVTARGELLPIARYAAPYLGCAVQPAMSGEGSIVLLLDSDAGIAPEGYRLEIAPDHIAVKGGDRGGVFNGIQALFRLLPPEVYAGHGVPAGTALPCALIEDAPRFAYRGMMLDVARTWIGKEAVKRYIDLLAYHSINKLHLHLTDDEGWRIEIRSHPELAETGGFRGGDAPIRPVYGKWTERYGGYFTQDEMRELIDYAALRNIEIIPEIDLPGHSRAIASVRPEIRCNYPPDTVSTNGYDYRSAWCVARESNYALLDDILGEICRLFPSEYIHIGGDEVEMGQWRRCPDCRALMRRLGIEDPRRLQDLFMERTAQILASYGKRPAVWNEAAASGRFTRRSRVHGWQSVAACRDAAEKGYPTVVMPAAWFYFDMRQSAHEAGHSWAAVFDASKTYGFDLAAQGFTPEQMRRVVGFEGAFWSEIYLSHEPEKPDYLDFLCFPRICALARLAWSGNDEGWEAWYKTLIGEHYDRLAAMGVRFRLFPPEVDYRDGALTAATDDGSTVFYRSDDGAEQPYTGPLPTAEPHRYRFFSRYKTARSPYAAHKSHYKTIAPPLTVTTSMGRSAKFPCSNAATYKGMARTGRACRKGDWILYAFAEPVACREVFLQTGYRQLPRSIVTTGYAEVSYDGATFERAGELVSGCFTLRPARPVRAVRIVSTADDNGTPYVVIQPPRIKP